MVRFVAYYRVSTAKQGRSGLGLAAQRETVLAYAGGVDNLLAEFTEVESGRKSDRPQLDAALRHCRATGAVLVVAKLDRLARDNAFLSSLLKEDGVPFVACDFPQADRVMLQILSVFHEYEARCASERTRAALQAAKARGQHLGNPNGAAALKRAGKGNGAAVETVQAQADKKANNLRDMVRDIQAGGVSTLAGIAGELTRRGARTPRGGRWHATGVKRLLGRLAAA
jgi:DNA invertase Pin-like site-specific DNA recombinase